MKKTVIIGAGPAGLTAAKELLKNKDNEVVILEASEAIGGISQTVRYNGNRMDIGGHRFFSKDDSIMEWWTNVMPLQGSPAYDDKVLERECSLAENGPDPEKEDVVMLKRHRVSRIYYKNHFFDYPVSLKWETIKNMGFFTTIGAGFSYLWSAVFKKKEDSLENFYINRFGKVLYKMFFAGYTEKLWGRSPKEISADWGAQRVKGLSIRAMLKDIFRKIFKSKGEVETSLIEEFLYPKYGPGQLWELVAEDVEKDGGQIHFNRTVTGVNQENGKITSVVCKNDRGEEEIFELDNLISSMPVNDLIGAFKDAPSDEVKAVAAGLPFRDFITVGLLVNKLELENKTKIKTLNGVVPDCWIYVQDCSVKLGRIQIFNNWSPYMVENPDETVWLGLEYFCTEGDELWSLSKEDMIALGIEELSKMGIIKKESVIDSHAEKIKKAYPAYFDTYSQFDVVKDYLLSFDNLYCVGRNGQHRYNNMDHSMLTSILTAKLINGGELKKEDIWSVNTEKSYHEKK